MKTQTFLALSALSVGDADQSIVPGHGAATAVALARTAAVNLHGGTSHPKIEEVAVDCISPSSPPSSTTAIDSSWRLWLWPNFLSLDAPLIAVLWQVLLTRGLAAHVRLGKPLGLALCVWLVYVADRVLDARRPLAGAAGRGSERKWMTLSEAVRKITSKPLARLRLDDRGFLRPGLLANVTVFDPDRVSGPADYDVPNRAPVGIRHVFLRGRRVG